MPENSLEHVSIIIPTAPEETAHKILLQDLDALGAEILVSSEDSRARSLNVAAGKARNEMLWFLHADSRVNAHNIAALSSKISQNPDALHYFDLDFGDGLDVGLARLNAMGANIRSRIFDLPYGDQGLCISKNNFENIGGFNEVDLGEDLLFVRKAKKAGVPIQRIPSLLRTSARKYDEVGWLKLTALRQVQFCKLMMQKL